MEFDYDGGGPAKGGLVRLYVDGDNVGEGRVERTEPVLFSADETCDVGFEAGSPVTADYPTGSNRFSGEVNWVQIDLGDDAEDADHFISPEERLRVALALQWALSSHVAFERDPDRSRNMGSSSPRAFYRSSQARRHGRDRSIRFSPRVMIPGLGRRTSQRRHHRDVSPIPLRPVSRLPRSRSTLTDRQYLDRPSGDP